MFLMAMHELEIMTKLFRPLILFGSLSLFFPGASTAQTADTLKTAETKLQFDAGPHSARLSNLQSGVEVWENRAVENLIPQAEMGGKSLPVEWNFNRSESHADKKTVSYIYDANSPRLRLTWEWEVRSDHGPIEHQIKIENRDSREVQIPMQASFVFDWKTVETDPFEELYVEKGADTPSKVGTHVVNIRQQLNA
jgi:hypothetical protein